MPAVPNALALDACGAPSKTSAFQVIAAAVGRPYSTVGDHRLRQWKEAGLPLPSTVTGIIRTIKQDMIIRKIGALPPEELANVEAELRVSLALVEAN